MEEIIPIKISNENTEKPKKKRMSHMMKIASRNESRNGTQCEINETIKPRGATRKLTKYPVCDWQHSSRHLCIATPHRDKKLRTE
jgi:hypothetical protein